VVAVGRVIHLGLLGNFVDGFDGLDSELDQNPTT
jgi:hypothetical protein